MLTNSNKFASDKTAKAFLLLSVSYLFLGLLLGVIGGLQYILPPFLKEQLVNGYTFLLYNTVGVVFMAA